MNYKQNLSALGLFFSRVCVCVEAVSCVYFLKLCTHSGEARESGESEKAAHVTVSDVLLVWASAAVKVKSTVYALSPLSPQEKMEIANIEPTQSIPLTRKELKGTLTEKEWWREEWAIARVCQVSSALCDTKLSDSSAVLNLVSKLFFSLSLYTCFPLFLSWIHSFSTPFPLFPLLTVSLSVSHPLWAAILQHMALPLKSSHMHGHMRLLASFFSSVLLISSVSLSILN